MTKLESLVAYSCALTDISGLSELANMRYLDLGHNDLEDISALSKMNKLEYLDISRSMKYDYVTGTKKPTIKNIEALKEAENLKFLSMQSHDISDITPLKDMSQLNTLYANNNKISDWSPISGLNIKDIFSAGNPVFHTGEVNEYYYDFDNPDQDTEIKSKVVEIEKFEDIEVLKGTNAHDFLPETVGVRLEDIEVTEPEDPDTPIDFEGEYVNDTEIRFKVVDEKGNLITKDLNFTRSSDNQDGSVPDMEFVDGYLSLKTHGVQRIISIGLNSEEYEMVNTHKYYEKYEWPSGNTIDYVEKSNRRVKLSTKDEDGNYILNDAEKDVLIINLKKIGETPEEPDEPIVGEEYVNDTEIRFKVVDEKGNLITKDLNFTRSSDNQDGSVPDMEFVDGYLSLKTHGVQRIISIGLNSEEYEMVNTHKYYEKYEWPSGNTIDYVEKSNRRVKLSTKDEDGNYILNDAEKDVLIINLKKIGETPEEPDEPIVPSDNKTYANPENIVFKVVDEQGEIIKKILSLNYKVIAKLVLIMDTNLKMVI
ncbi:leucine-rich repeat domain-containing protein [Microaceticoccus formicicus]|uniref:leucine-rich repeat domain-containing protein n=1 Tax=Microaceticoccus formicicus TaxID=3118105 RepID=UPI003CD011B1|nr:hypothetical protein VZL98_02750 [Peptoniphilaceae bacterium AMB_02]